MKWKGTSMKRKNRIFMILVGCFLLLGLLAGCGKKMTAEELLKGMGKNTEQVKSMEGDFALDMDLRAAESGVSMSMGMGMEGTLEMIKEPAAMHMKGVLKIDLMNLNMDFELYSVQEKGKAVTYVKAADQWKRMEVGDTDKADEVSESNYTLLDFIEENLTLAKETEKADGQEVYVLSGVVSGKKLDQQLAPLKETLENAGESVDFKKADIPLTLKVYKETKLPASVELDCSDFINNILNAAYTQEQTAATVDNCRMTIGFTKYDGIKDIAVPQEALDAASQDMQSLMKGIDGNSEAAGEEEPDLELGVTKDRTYTSEFLGLSCTIPEDWDYYTEDQMKEMNKVVYDAMGDGNLKEAIANADIIYDMFAVNQATRQNINIIIENMGFRYGTVLNESTYLNMSVEQVKSALEGIGITDITAERNTVEMAGETREGILITGNSQGMAIYEQLVAISNGNHMACITFTCFDENTLADMQGYFAAL